MSIEMTDAAMTAVKEAMKAEAVNEKEVYLRVGVRSGGCSGIGYVLAFDDQVRSGDSLVEKDGIRMLIDGASTPLLAGATIDYSSGPYEEGFVFLNPNVEGKEGGCACGGSCDC
jgi:iron-sulfur cluster assembly protein